MEMDLKSIEWGEFDLNEIFPDIQRGKRLKKDDHKAGIQPYVSSSALNNGIDGFVGNTVKVRKFSNCLTIANSGSVGATFFQPFSFVASDHITKLENKNFNKYVYLFISCITKRLSEKYSFNREINDKRIQREKIILPINQKSEPDYAFMEQYMRKKEQEKITKFENYINKRIEQVKDFKEIVPLNEKEWGVFEIGKLFKLYPGKSKGLNHLKKTNLGVNYLGATNSNNGVLAYVESEGNEKMIQKGNCIAFIRNGEGSMGFSIYKAENFIATSDISVGYSNFLNREIGLFITTIADKVRGKYNFGYKRSDTRLKKEKLQLPIDKDGQPDFDYMVNYIKKLEYEKLTKYMKYKYT
ncbi:MAG: restriction endonuclease subunit S [Breznakibacter sp.]